MNRYTFTCLWRPAKDQWPVHGAQWRLVSVDMYSNDSPEQAACDACLQLIAIRRGQAKAVSVFGGEAGQEQPLSHIHFNWSWCGGVVPWGGCVVEVNDSAG